MGNMDLWQPYMRESSRSGFGKSRLSLKTGNRWHTSLSMVAESSVEVELNKALSAEYPGEKRYIIAKDITFDLFVSVYDVDTASAFVFRPSQYITGDTARRLKAAIRKARFRNAEMRVIGLQDNDPSMLGEASKVRASMPGIRLAEADLFGNETRHIALDLKTGSTYDLLLGNRIYTPAELINKVTAGDFAQKRSELALV